MSKNNKFLVATLLAVRLSYAFFGIIADCDEVYNYWEPLNFLIRNFGKQTWEYAPEYGLRSWCLLLIFSIVKYPFEIINRYIVFLPAPLSQFSIHPKVYFYTVRVLLALFTSLSELKLSNSLRFAISDDVSSVFLILQIFNPGMSHASISLLPSSLCLILGMLSTSSIVRFMRHNHLYKIASKKFKTVEIKEKDTKDKSKTILPQLRYLLDQLNAAMNQDFAFTTVFYALSGVLSWPFCLVLPSTFYLYSVLQVLIKREFFTIVLYFVVGIASVGFIGLMMAEVDWIFYQNMGFVPWNMVSYNVLNASSDAGPDIFGVEDITYYIKNLLLNFNLSLPFALLGLVIPFINPILCLNVFKIDSFDLLIFLSSIFVWCGIFFSQAHKEERFLYPIYHLINISASISIVYFTSFFKESNIFVIKFYNFLLKSVIVITYTSISISRIFSLLINYSAPIRVFDKLSTIDTDAIYNTENVCLGREWYHYPSSFFLDDNMRLKFVESGFRGMLPGDFKEYPENTWANKIKSISSNTTIEFNNKNIYNPETVVDFNVCDYYIDIVSDVNTDMGEIALFAKNGKDEEIVTTDANWEVIYCDSFINSDESSGISKILYLPSNILEFLPEQIKELIPVEYHSLFINDVKYYDYCLAKKKN